MMRYVEKIAENIWKIKADSNVYFLDFEEKILIDTGNRKNRSILEQFLKPMINFERISKVIFTHLHYDHIGNFDLFRNAEFFASEESIESLKNNPFNEILDEEMAHKFKVDLMPLHDFDGLQILKTPGHTKGSICLWYEKEKILFSGDTLFFNKKMGRVDLPTSAPEDLRKSLVYLLNYNFKVLCPGHEY